MAAALHPPDDALAAFGLGRLDESATDEVARHLESCPDCRRRAADVPVDDFLGRLRDAAAAQADTSRQSESVADAPAGGAPAGLPPELAAATQYADIRELGRGGMGVVYLARNTIMDRLEVLKVVTRSADRFVREIQAAARLKHPNVVGAYSAQRYGGTLVFAMEYVPGDDLAQLVKARGPLPVPHACNYAYQAALGLQHAHENGMVHRDIKPSNLILHRDGNKPVVKILDFGLAKGTSESKLDTSRTAEGAMLGTPDYIAPEQTLDAAKADIRSDVYSLGCTLYHLLAGRPPFVGRSLYEVLRAHHSAQAVRLSLVRPEVPDELAGVVAKMMAKDPARRYPTPAAAAAALTPFFKPGARATAASLSVAPPSGGRGPALGRLEPAPKRPSGPPPLPSAPPDASPVEPPRRARRRLAWAAGLLAAALLVIGTAGLLVKTRNGTIVLEGLPPDADVLVDGETVTVKRNGDEATVTVARGGPYGLKIKLGDRELRTSDATVTIGGDPVRIKVQDYEPTPEPAPIPAAGDRAPAAVPRPEKKAPGPDRTARTNGAGQWRVEGGKVIQSDAVTDNCVLVFGDPEWTDYDYSFEAVKTDGAFGVSAVFRARDAKNFMVFDLAGWQNRKHTVEVQADGKFHHWVNADRAGSMARDRTYRVEVRARGDHFVCSIDGQVIYDVHDSHFARGAVGLRCWGGAVRVGSILVKSPDGTVLWEGPPELLTPADPKARRPHAAQGRWRIDGDELVQEATNSGYTVLTFGDPNWSDYDLTCEVKRTGGAHEVQLKYRIGPPGKEVFGLGGWDNKDDFATSAPTGKRWNQRTAKSAGVPSDQWIAMRVKVRGTRCECYRGDKLLFSYDGTVNRKGVVGLGTNATAARFRNVRVTDPGGTLLWAGLPALPPSVGAAPIDPKIRASVTNRGDWSIDGTEIVQTNHRDGDCEIVFGDPAWTDYNFVCEAKVVAGFGGEISQTFRVTEAGRYEWVLGRWNGHNYSLGSVARDQEKFERVWWAPLDRADRDRKLDLDRWYTMEVRVRGSKVECLVDGASIVQVDHDRFKGGRVGLRTYRTSARYRDLKVTDPGGKVLFEGLPELPAKAVDWIQDS